jgi:hypothetical protein
MSSSADSPASIRFMSARQVLSDALASASIFLGTIGLPSKLSHEEFLETRRSRHKQVKQFHISILLPRDLPPLRMRDAS